MEHQVSDYGPGRRRLWLPKLRGQAYSGGFHDLCVTTGGLRVFPRLDAAVSSPPSTSSLPSETLVSSGSVELDALGQGLDLEAALTAGLLTLRQINPGQVAPGGRGGAGGRGGGVAG